jgi:hypothetical protein
MQLDSLIVSVHNWNIEPASNSSITKEALGPGIMQQDQHDGMS